MIPFRGSHPVHRSGQKHLLSRSTSSSEHEERPRNELTHSQPPQNAFIIPGRTRYPSDRSPSPPEQLDLQVARALLDKQREDARFSCSIGSNSSSSRDIKKSQGTQTNTTANTAAEAILRQLNRLVPGKNNSLSKNQNGIFDGTCDTKTTSRDTSGQYSSDLSGPSFPLSSAGSNISSAVVADTYATIYNRLAEKHSLRQLQDGSVSSICENTGKHNIRLIGVSNRHGPKDWILSKLTRTASSKNLQNSRSRLGRKNSLGSILGYRTKVSLQSQTLDDICRLGGVGVVDLPQKYVPVRLEMPTCLAATANYLAYHCRDTPGIFRIPGQTSITNALYNHYLFRIRDPENFGHIEATIGSLDLPVGLSPSVHDVASTFKKFLWDLPGGILGSTDLFETIKEICDLPNSDNTSLSGRDNGLNPDKTRLIALAIISMSSEKRLTLICSVFGLLAFLKSDRDVALNNSPSRYLVPESMGSHALGVVFAPILLGNLTEDVDRDDVGSRASSHRAELVTPRRGLIGHRKTPKRTLEAKNSFVMAAGFENAKACCSVAAELIRSWEDISSQILCLRDPQVVNNGPTRFPLNCMHRAKHVTRAESSHERSTARSNGENRALSLQESKHTPRLEWEAHGPQSLPYPPTPSLHFDANLHRSASICIMPNSHASDSPHIQFQTPSDLRKLARSNTALHLSDPVGRSPINLSVERSAKMAQDLESRAWWEHSTPTSASKTLQPVASPVQRMYGSSIQSHRASRASQAESDGAKDDAGTSDSISVVVSYPRLSMNETEGPSLDDKASIPVNSSNERLEVDLSKRRRSSSGTKRSRIQSSYQFNSIDDSAATLRYEKANQTVVTDSFSADVAAAGLPGTARCSPSMIPRPVNSASRHQGQKIWTKVTTPASGDLSVQSSAQSARDTIINRNAHDQIKPHRADETNRTAHDTVSQRLPPRMCQTGDRALVKDQLQTAQLPRTPGPQFSEPPVARRINFRPSPKENVRGTPSSSGASHIESVRTFQQKPNGTLYAEIRRLHGQLSGKNEEIAKQRHQIEAMKRFRDSGTLSEKLREAQRDTRMWRYRAQWAETELFGQTLEREVPETMRLSLKGRSGNGSNAQEGGDSC